MPMGQDSLWGQARKVFCDYMQENLFDKLDRYWLNMSPATCDADDLANWEVDLGIPVNPAKALELRRAFVELRRYRGPFTRTIRARIVEMFILATIASPIIFTPEGVAFTEDGIPFGDELAGIVGTYNVVENIPGFSYQVLIASGVDLDTVGLSRELDRMTPAPITFTVESTNDPFMQLTGTLTLSGNEVTDATRTTASEGDAETPPAGIGVFQATENLEATAGIDVSGETTTGHTTGSGNTLSASTEQHLFGTHSLKAVYGGDPVLLSTALTLPS